MKPHSIALMAFLPANAVAQQGSWEDAFNFGPSQVDRIVAVHLVHVFDGTQGKVVAITNESNALGNCGTTTYESDLARLWTFPVAGAPGPGSFETAPLCRTFMFCEGHCALADGRTLNVGGMIALLSNPNPPPLGTPQANLFDAAASAGNHWNTALTPPDMAQGRWYPTATTLWDAADQRVKVLACSGLETQGNSVADPERCGPAAAPGPMCRAPSESTRAEQVFARLSWHCARA